PMSKPILNIEHSKARLISEFKPGSPEKYQGAAMAEISAVIGGKKLGYNLTIVPPGKTAFPMHNHYGNEEMFFIIEGVGQVRIGTETFAIRNGDVIACPAGGKETAHQIINNSSTQTLRYLAVSTMQSPDLVQYPDSGKTGAAHYLDDGPAGSFTAVRILNNESDNLGYWDGE
ncbi:MAG: cupin domain-containing protein, partial [Arenimonas sp.]